ncbi:hypothetical protein AWM75_05220 [Aerococcus urinaehominis]|uniref:Uncharacterized protein n=1 Tax=Aerococcus urinaehominis TaxID=128944 RepID=A0A120IAX3_9LACT|nr:phage holin family protein [Aerococcus urinaehominis]AMB99431.1 hypothetical protein AWM75_05220 [Aerococcus urinaehominis]SDM29352.1 putative membrane protein [Aerococcus urinaehominis]
MTFILKILIDALGLFLLAMLLAPDVYIASFGTAVLVAVVLAFVNQFIRPIAKILSFPLNLLSLGLFSWVVNGFMLVITSWFFASGFNFTSFGYAILMAMLFSIYHWFVDRVLGHR